MKDALFQDLEASVREGGAILQGETKASRTFEAGSPDVKRIRARYRLTQTKFATMLGISVKTLRNWEQGRRVPGGPAKVLLRVADKHPQAILDTFAGGKSRD